MISTIEYNLLEKKVDRLVYEVTIFGEKKEVEFLEKGDIYDSAWIVYVSICETQNSYTNKVRKSFLRVNSELVLLDYYTVLNKPADVVSWVDSERGKSMLIYESVDGQVPYPVSTIDEKFPALRRALHRFRQMNKDTEEL